MRVNCQLERQKEDTEGQRGQGREEDKGYGLFTLTGNGEWDILGGIIIEMIKLSHLCFSLRRAKVLLSNNGWVKYKKKSFYFVNLTKRN